MLRKKPADEFRVPGLAEADSTYAALLAKQAELLNKQSALRDEINGVDKQLIDARAARQVSDCRKAWPLYWAMSQIRRMVCASSLSNCAGRLAR